MKHLWFQALGMILLLAGGCANPSPPYADYAQTAYQSDWAATSLAMDGPTTLPIEPELSGENTLDFYVQVALERNPQVLAAQHIVAAQAEVIPQVTALADPMLTETFQPLTENSLQTAAGRGPNLLTLSQKFPWFGKLRVRGEVAEQGTRIALTRLAQAQIKVIEDVHIAYYELYYLQQAIEITKASKKPLQDLLKSIQSRLTTGKTSFQDGLRIELELAQVQNRLIELKKQLAVSQADLAKLLHASPEISPAAGEIMDVPSVPTEIEQLYEAAVRCRPELQEQLHAIVRNQRKEELAQLQYYPDVTAGIGWQAITNDNALAGVANGNDNLAFMVGINIPLQRDKLRAGVREAEHRVIADARRYDATRDDTFRLIKRLIVQARSIDEQLRLFHGNIIPDADQSLRLSVTNYSVGTVDFERFIDDWTNLLAFQIQVERLKASLGQTLASLERVVGCELATLPTPAEALPVIPPSPDTNEQTPGTANIE